MEVRASSSSSSRRILLLILFIFSFSPTITAIRKDVSFQTIHPCKTTVQGRYLLSDENGYVCNALSVNSRSRCCPPKGEKFSCHECNLLSQCCNSYEYCVSCCLNPALTSKEQVLKMKVAKPATARTYTSVFDYCAGRCRHSSESVVHENAYISDFHHCFSLPSNSSYEICSFSCIEAGKNSTLIEARLNGINVVVGRQGESCNSVCKSRGQLCVPNKLAVLNNCDIIQKYMSCKGSCLSSVGSDQPAEVVYDAPMHLNPGSCLYTQTVSMLSCDGLHQHTRRLCPCA
ncbi:hypothetical protein LR48_Vigan08g163300 [Vigna angularis]|uniref:SREBP regulating gene protein n=1 Tax=Phaseolus angularis TaxID=3914 RepID=A0A0L9V6X3_PHAAN|nr:uncharacterized protein HKW66_Vig0139470 [Vigna angularis]KOM50806.1 hypothetical protein LR48_Vigan08g163300 [Vigna angularis]